MGVDAELLARELFTRLVLQKPRTPALYGKQENFAMSEAHHAAFVGGIGSGKSWAGNVRALRAAFGWIGERRILTPNLGVITAPTYPMLRDATLRTFMDIAGDYVADFNKSEMLATLVNGSEVIFRSTDKPERLRGPSISWWFGDEAAMYTPSVRKIMLGRLRQGGQLGFDWLATTPKGRNWVWQTFVRDRGDDPNYLLVRARSRENIFLDDAILEMWEGEYSGDFSAQELDAEFVAFEGLIYAHFDRNRHVVSEMPEKFQRVIAGVDWGFANPGVVLVFGVDEDRRLWGLAEEYQRRRRVEEWAEVARQMRDTWGIERFFCDPSAPDNLRAFENVGLKVEAAENSVLTGIQKVQNRLVVQGDGKPRLVLSHGMANTVTEFEQYQWAENRHGLRDEPVKANDHAMDSLRYAVMGVDYWKVKPLKAEARRYA